MRGASDDDRAGFALVDMLVALAVAGLAAAAMAGLVAFVQAQAAQAEARTRAQDGIVAARRVLLALLAEAPPILGAGPEAVAAKGSPEAFTVNSFGPEVIGLDHPVPFTLRVEPDGERRALVLVWRTKPDAAESREIVAEGVSRGELAYFVRRGPAGPGSRHHSWQDSWDGRSGRLAAIRLVMSVSAAPDAIDIVVPVMVDRPNVCLRHPTRRGCEPGDP